MLFYVCESTFSVMKQGNLAELHKLKGWQNTKNSIQLVSTNIIIHIQGVSQRYSPPLELNPKGLGKKQKYCYKLY